MDRRWRKVEYLLKRNIHLFAACFLSVSCAHNTMTGAGDMLVTSLLDLSLYSSFSKDGSFGKTSSFVDELTDSAHVMMWDKWPKREHLGDGGVQYWHRWWHGCVGRCSPTPSFHVHVWPGAWNAQAPCRAAGATVTQGSASQPSRVRSQPL